MSSALSLQIQEVMRAHNSSHIFTLSSRLPGCRYNCFSLEGLKFLDLFLTFRLLFGLVFRRREGLKLRTDGWTSPLVLAKSLHSFEKVMAFVFGNRVRMVFAFDWLFEHFGSELVAVKLLGVTVVSEGVPVLTGDLANLGSRLSHLINGV